MARQLKKKTIFISYSWHKSSKPIADQIYADLTAPYFKDKLTVLKDDHQLTYKSSIDDFMTKIRKSDYAILLIGDSYLKSYNCMREVINLYKDINYKDKMLPILIGDADIHRPAGKLAYVEYWKKECEALELDISAIDDIVSSRESIEDLTVKRAIKDHINTFLHDVSVMYHPTLEEMKENSYETLLKSCKIPIEELSPQSLIDTDKHILEQLHQAVEIYHKSLCFIPVQRLKYIYPLTIKGYSYITAFHLTTDNDNITDFLNNLERLYKGESDEEIEAIRSIHDYQDKVNRVIKALLNNNIHRISSQNSRKSFDLIPLYKAEDSEDCQCLTCLYNKFDYSALIESLKVKSEHSKLDDLMEIAFTQYKIGNYKASINLYRDCSIKALSEKKLILKYISDYNIIILSSLLRIKNKNGSGNWYVDNFNSRSEILPDSNKIKQSGFHKELFSWINNGHFFTDEYYKVDTALANIKSHYIRFINNGFSYNQNIFNLIFSHKNLSNFLNHNGIVYDHYSDYKSFAIKYAEGIIISNVLPIEQTGFDNFRSDLMGDIIRFSEPKELLNLILQYKLSKFRCDDGTKEELILWLRNFINSLGTITPESLDESNRFFFDNRIKILSNFLILFRYIDFGDNVSVIADCLKRLLQKDPYTVSLCEEYLFGLFIDMFESIPKRLAAELLRLSYNKGLFHSSSGYHTLNSLTSFYKLPFDKVVKLDNLITHDDNPCAICGYQHNLSDIVPLLRFYKKEKTEIQIYLRDSLEKEFHLRTCYLALWYGLIDFTLFGNKFIEQCIISTISRPSTLRPFEHVDKFTPNSDFCMLISICLLHKAPLNHPDLEEIKGLNPFYEWVLCPKGFDYSNFDVLWLKYFNATTYKNKHFNLNKIKNTLQKYLSNHKDNYLENLYINL